MSEHQYVNEPLPKLQFDKKRSRVKYCPCGKKNKDGKFSPYVGYENKGYCHSCGETFLPELPKERWQHTIIKKEVPKPVSFIPFDLLEKSLRHHSENNFVKFLCSLFGTEITTGLIEKYFIGTSKHWDGATVFWQIAKDGIRTGKIMLYNSDTGKRVKEPFTHVHWVHSIMKIEDFNLRQCFFGEYLLKDNTKPVAIVESEKTAVIANVYLPQFIWLAVGSLTNLSAEKCKVLRGRNVILFPDLNGFEKWTGKAKELSRLLGTQFNISDLLERKASETERQQGLDLADYLIRFDYKEFQESEQPTPRKQVFEEDPFIIEQNLCRVREIHTIKKINYSSEVPTPKPQNWNQNITELEHYFEKATLPAVPVKLNACQTITDISKFIAGHLATVKVNNGKRTFLPYLERLQQLQQHLTINTN